MAPSTFPPYVDNTTTEESAEDTKRAIAAVRNMIDFNLYIGAQHDLPTFDKRIMQNFQIVTASGKPGDSTTKPSAHPSSLLELDVVPEFTNANAVMHGGATSTIFDMATATSLAPIQKAGYWDFMGGLSRSLNVSFVKAIPMGTKIRIRSWVVQHGRTASLIRSQMESLDGSIIYATCEHHKIQVPKSQAHSKFVEGWAAERSRKENGGTKL